MPTEFALSFDGPADAVCTPLVGKSHSVPFWRNNETTEFRLIDTEAAFMSLESAWNDLFERAGRPSQVFQTFDWNRHWVHAYLGTTTPGANHCKLAVLTAWRADRLVLVMPFVIERTASMKCLKWMGEPVTQYGDVLVEDGADTLILMRKGWQELSNHLRPDAAWLRFVRQDAAVAPLLSALQTRSLAPRTAPFLSLEGTAEAEQFLSRYGSKARKNRRRQARRLSEQATITVVAERAGPAAERLTQSAIAMKRSWLNARHTYSSAFANHRFDAFFSRVTREGAANAEPWIVTLNANGNPIAAAIALECKRHIMLHILTYSQDYARFGAGIQVFEELLKNCFASNIAGLDFMAPGSSFKEDWTKEAIPVDDHALAMSAAGYIYVHGFLAIVRPAVQQAACWWSKSACQAT